MARIFTVDSPHTRQLDAVVSGLEQVEAQMRRLEARRAELFACAVGVAAAECAHVAAEEVAAARKRAARNDADADAEAGTAAGAGADDTSAAHTRKACTHEPTGDSFELPSGPRAELAMRAVRAELAAALRLSESTIERHLDTAAVLAGRFPGIATYWHAGRVSAAHVRVMVDAATVIGAGDTPEVTGRRAAYEAAVLEVAVVETPNRLRSIARRLAEQLSERSIDERHRVACKLRRVLVRDHGDGMADLVAYIPSVEAVAIYNRLVAASKRVAEMEAAAAAEAATSPAERSAGDANERPVRRTRDEIRADLLTDLLTKTDLDTEADSSGIRAHVQVIVPVEVLPKDAGEQLGAVKCSGAAGVSPGRGSGASPVTGRPVLPVMLTGHGPLDTATAHRLVGTASAWEVVRVNGETGVVLSVERYSPSEGMRRVLRARDQHCRFLGCQAPLSRCDIDHTVDAQYGGPTAETNLSHLCRGHHTLKHHGGWGVTQDGEGTLAWVSPTGRRYRQAAPSRVMFRPVGAEPRAGHTTAQPF